ncbi:hypothetical protein BM525_19760 (plasmid) [Alteromonas mediterranea]|uniref:Uncharacterized protein n=1 Tax=Alteromonas mediterranea TaxID=314275 RepID=A0AAC9JF03_9ALTE|nr:hypothetical protein [Alteromonas mediterranea]APD92121.1 hypothetical protein BM524_19565 [Alteromonas mediterranea]APD99975.1 hypothetical protein BM525_19760 [Alteromonas mediterranea]
MTPFLLQARLITPCVYNRPIRLPGLLYHALLSHYCDEDKAQSALPTLLKENDGVFHGSSLIFGIQPESPVIACFQPSLGIMRNESDFNRSLISPNGRGGKYVSVQLDGGATKTRLGNNQAYHAPFVTFFGYGHSDKITALLNHYVSAVGINATRGAGTLAPNSWDAREISEDHSLIDITGKTGEANRGMPLTPLPEELFKALSPKKYGDHESEMVALRPPYYKNTELKLCAVPEKVSRQLI